MTRSIPWLRVFIEGVVIVGSILVAFGIDAWWEDRQERADEQEILLGLETDFKANLAQLQTVIDTHLGFDRRLAGLDTMTAAQLAEIPFDSVRPYLMALNGVRTFDAQDGTVDGVISSGKLGLIRDSGLRAQLVQWKGEVEDLSEEAREFRSAGERVFLRTTELGGPWRGDVLSGAGDPEHISVLAEARLSLPPANLSVIGGDVVLMNLARAKRTRALGYLNELFPLVEQADSVLALVRANRR